jgi:predicted AAA+ superfamily ATPase
LSKFYFMFQRAHYQVLVKRLVEPRRFLQVVVGPRQVGKTTLVQQVMTSVHMSHHFASADGVGAGTSVWLEQQWMAARLKMQSQSLPAFLLVIDEIQKVPNWSETVKRLWDDDTLSGIGLRVVLLGSSRTLIQDGLTESLAGRFEILRMGHWSYTEMQAAFGLDIDRYIWFGGYPGSAGLLTDESRWKAYVREALIEPTISKDILMMTRVDKPILMRRLFELGCLHASQILSFTKMLGQLQDARNTVTLSHYLHLLDLAGLLCGIEKYEAQLIRQRSSSPKFQVHNTAIISSQRHETLSEGMADHGLWGRITESAVGAHLLNHSLEGGYRLSYWRKGPAEIDFVIERAGHVVGIEVKSNHETTNKGMELFKTKYKPDRVLLVGPAGLPISDFLTLSPSALF